MPEAVPGQQQAAPAEQVRPVQAEPEVPAPHAVRDVLRQSAAGQAGPSPAAGGWVRATAGPA